MRRFNLQSIAPISKGERVSGPQTHYQFQSAVGWINDPNGLVALNGQYHLFFQHNPGGKTWGPMHWGHATSPDLVTWTELPVALAPTPLGDAFSGSIVADYGNHFGLNRSGKVALVAFFTRHDVAAKASGRSNYETQAAAYSLDSGVSWTEYENNPILPNPGATPDFRDPHVFRAENDDCWIMLLAAGDRIQIYRGTSLENWTIASEFSIPGCATGEVYECPALFQVPVSGSPDAKWVLVVSFNPGGLYGGSGTRYLVGDFDGYRFSADPEFLEFCTTAGPQWLDWGPDHYATAVWANLPGHHDRPVGISWMNNWAYANETLERPFRGRMTLPRSYGLAAQGKTLVVISRPAVDVPGYSVSPRNHDDPAGGSAGMYRLDAYCAVEDATGSKLSLEGPGGALVSIEFDPHTNVWIVDRNRCGPAISTDLHDSQFVFPRISTNPVMKASVYVARSGIEVFLDDGVQAATFLLRSGMLHCEVRSQGWQIRHE